MLETLDYTIRIGSTPTFLYFNSYLYSAYTTLYVYYTGNGMLNPNIYVTHLFIRQQILMTL